MSTDKWNEFKQRHMKAPILKSACESAILYAVPSGLVQILKDRRLLDPAAIAFEWELAGLTGGGFWNGHPFAYAPLIEPAVKGVPSAREKQIDARLQVTRDALDDLAHGNCDLATRQASRERSEQLRAERDEKLATSWSAYAGWLIMDRGFRSERDSLRHKWHAIIGQQGRFPEYPVSLIGEEPACDEDFSADCNAEFRFFYRRWGLDGFATWELPLPMRPEVNNLFYSVDEPRSTIRNMNGLALGSAGVLMFLPWCMLRDKKLSVRDVVNMAGGFQECDHVAEWLRVLPHHKSKWGPKRFADMLRIYKYGILALAARYPDLTWSQIDWALATYLRLSLQSVEKNRQKLTLALQSVDKPVTSPKR